MSNKTAGNLQLNKPLNGEFQNNWDEPLNQNSDTVDAHVTELEDEVLAARGNTGSLEERLVDAIDPDGQLLPLPENVAARVSQASGRFNSEYARLNQGDAEILGVRAGGLLMVDGLAAFFGRNARFNRAVSGPVGGNNAANFLTSAGSVFTIEGDPTPVLLNVGGYVQKVRIDAPTDLTGQAAGTKFIYATRGTTGRLVDSSIGDGTTGGTDLNQFQSLSAHFLSNKVAAGDFLNIQAGDNQGRYVVASVTDEHNLLIVGKFNIALGGIPFEIRDMLHPTVAFESTKVLSDTKCYLGECEFDGTNITAIFTYAYNGEFESDWVAVDVSSTPTFLETFNHNLGVLPKDIKVLVAATNDETSGSFFAEHLSVADVASDYQVGFSAGTGDASVSPSGGPYPTRSVKAKLTRKAAVVGNVRNSIFYKDFTGTLKDTGYLKLIVRG